MKNVEIDPNILTNTKAPIQGEIWFSESLPPTILGAPALPILPQTHLLKQSMSSLNLMSFLHEI
jgi:hypothetical protein